MRINKYIASTGFCSRRKAEELILDKKVFINGKIVDNLATQVDENNDIITIDNEEINLENDKIYIVLNKPKGYITTNSEQFNRKCVMDLIHEDIRVFPVGRLDMDTEGMLILTNDGEFANELMHPKNEIYKTYIAKINYDISDAEIEELSTGVDIGGYITRPAFVKRIKRNLVEIKIAEGKNRQVRRMFESINKRVIKLKRISIGNMSLGDIKLGEYKKFNLTQIKSMLYK